jgi:hypothetical protein
MSDYANFFELVGKIILNIRNAHEDSDCVTIETDGGTYTLYHNQDCCESVDVIRVMGNPNDLIGQRVTGAEEDAGASSPSWFDSSRWCSGGTLTRFSLMVENGSTLDIWWNGVSNGYYSEAVSVAKS